MHNRFILPKVILMTVAVVALLAIPALALADSRDNLQSMAGNEQQQNFTRKDADAGSAKRPVYFQRTNYFWPYAVGPYYGDAPASLMHSPHWLRTMVGIFDTRNPITRLPGELHKDLSPLSQNGMQYFIVQFEPDAFDRGGFLSLRREFESMGVQFFDFFPNRAYTVLLNAANYQMVASSSAVKFIEPYHPAFKISPYVGRTPLLDPVKAVSPIYSLDVLLFPNESAELVAMQISKLGGFIKTAAADTIKVDIDRSLIGEIAKIEAVKAILEDIPVVLHAEETTSTMQVGNNTGPDMAIPYFDVGVDGSGGGINNAVRISVIDSGVSLDAKDFSDTASSPGTAGPSHRKVYAYVDIDTLGTGAGDLLTCDDPLSGGYTHGHVVSQAACGNATDVPGWAEEDKEYFYDGVGDPWKLDGVAKGALLVFYDCYVNPGGICDEGCSAGDLYIGTSGGALGDGYVNKGARAFNMSWGGGSTYDTHAADIDAFLYDNKEAMVFASAGNDGNDADNDNIPDERTTTAPATFKCGIGVGMCYNSNTSSGYNPEARVYESSCGPVGTFSKPRVQPILMAPGDDPYGAGSNMGMDSEYACKSRDNDQTGTPICDVTQGSAGTSFASPAAMGAFALVNDYFHQGFYPDGTSGNDNNGDDTLNNVSGALVKAVLIASADWMSGPLGNLTKDYRNNYEQGYGRIQLDHILPLVTDPDTPTGLIIDDQGLDTGSGVGAGLTIQDVFDVTDVDQTLRIAVAWVEDSGEDLANDLDLTVGYDSNSDGTLGPTEPTWWGNYFTEDWMEDDTGTPEVDLRRDGTLNGYEDNNLDGSMNSSEWSLRLITPGNAQRDFLNPQEAVFIDSDQLNDLNNDGTLDDPMVGQWIWQLTAGASNPDTQKYGLVIGGGVVLGSNIRFDKSPVLCSDIVHVTVNETEPAPTAAAVSGQVTIYVDDPGTDGEFDTTDDVVYDTLTGVTFTQVGTAKKYISEDIPVTDATAASSNDILEMQDGHRLRAVYNDTSESKTKFGIAATDCTVKLQKGVTFIQWGRDYRYLIDGGCEVNGLGLSFPDHYMDVDEKVVYWIAVWNGDDNLTDVEVTLQALTAGTATPSPYVTVQTPSKVVGTLNANSTMGIPFEIAISGSPPFPTEVDMKLGLKAAKSGKTVEEFEIFTHLINADDEVYHYSTDYPTGGTEVEYDYDDDEVVGALIAGKNEGGQLDAPGQDWDLWYERIKYDDMTTTAYGGGNPGFTGVWNFDSDDEGFRSGIHPESTQGAWVIANFGEDMNWDGTLQAAEDRDPTGDGLSQNWALQSTDTLQCGYQTPYGIWRTGSSKPSPKSKDDCAGSGAYSDFKCQFYETRSGSTGADFFFEILKSPELHKVHQNPDGNGYDYYSEFHYMTLAWNQQVDLVDDFVQVTYEVDTDTTTDIGIKVDDFTVLGLYNGAMTIRGGGDGNQNLLDGFSVFAPSDNKGDETNDTSGIGSRVGSRGCYFQQGDGVDPDSPHGLARPEDDGVDNDGDGSIDEYVTINGPIRNMDTFKNNGLPPWWTLEDLYGDAGEDYEAAFGFFVSEGTSDGTPTAGWGLAIDDVVLAWDEMHPVEDNVSCATNGQCAALSVKTIDMYEGNSLVPVSVLDFNAQTTQAVDSEPDGLYEIQVHARSEAEPAGEYFTLEQVSTGSYEYAGVIPISSAYDAPGTIYIKREGVNLPTLIVKYVDEDDGVHTYDYGADGSPGEAGVDDDADGTTDEEDGEFCPIGAGEIFRAYGDDNCGCPNNPLELGSEISYTVGRMAIEQVTIVSDNGDNDGFADACETVTMDIRLKNLARVSGEFIPLTGVTATIQKVTDADNDGTDDATIDCIQDPSASYGDMDALASATNDVTNRYSFQVACAADRTSIYQNLNATFDLNVSAAEIDGLYQPLRFSIPIDLDQDGTQAEIGEEYEDFDLVSTKIEFLRVAHQDGTRCQYNDPDNPDGFSYERANCTIDNFPGYTDQDWHIHDTTMPDSGRAYDGDKSMHWGYHSNPSDAGGDTLHFQEMGIARMKAANRVNIGLGNPELTFKHQLNLLDNRWSNTPAGEAADRAIVMVAKTDNAGVVQCDPNEADRCWYKIFPYDNVYNAQGTDQFTNCTFDPIDDGSNEDDFFPNETFWGPSSMCFPQFCWSWMGDTDHQAVYDPDNVGAGNGPGLAGNIGPGTWVESKFSLYEYRGYQVRMRWIVTTIENFPAQHYLQAGWPTNMDGDDGWYVDDIRISGMYATPVTLTDDTYTNPTNTCPTLPEDKCDTITPVMECLSDNVDNDQDGTIDEAGENNCLTLAPGHTFTLSAAKSSPDKCVDGGLNYKFWLDEDADDTLEGTDTVLYEWSDKNVYADNPVGLEHYCVEVRCASDPDCNAVICDDAGYGEPTWLGEATLNFQDGSKTVLEFYEDPPGVGATSFDLIVGNLSGDTDNTNALRFSGSYLNTLQDVVEIDETIDFGYLLVDYTGGNTYTHTPEPDDDSDTTEPDNWSFFYLVRANKNVVKGTWGTEERNTGIPTP